MKAVLPGRRPALVVLGALMFVSITGATAMARNVPPEPEQLPRGVVRSEEPQPTLDVRMGARARDFRHRVPPPLEETIVFFDSLNGLSLDSLAGWTHFDESFRPTSWNISTFLACQNHAWWCGVVDSTWAFDSDRSGYGNGWNEMLANYCPTESLPNNQSLYLSFKHHINAEPNYDYGYVEVYDPNELWISLASFTGKVPNGAGCDTVTVLIPDALVDYYKNFPTDSGTIAAKIPFRFRFRSDIAYSSEDGLYQGDGWVIDNITFKAGNKRVFFDDMEGGMKQWERSINPAVGDYFQVKSNILTEDVCTDNRTNIWVDWNNLTQSLIPGIDNVLNTPPINVERSSQVSFSFDVYRNLPLNACFYYHLNFRTKNIGDANWGQWIDPTRLLYYGSQKDWARQRVLLPGASNKDSLQVQLGLKDYAWFLCDGISSPAGVYAHFDNVAVGIVKTAPPFFVTRDVDLFQSTFQTTPFFRDDNFNSPLGDSVVVQINASRGYKTGFLNYRFNGGSFSSVPLHRISPALANYYDFDVPPNSYPANTKMEYYFSVTDSTDAVAYSPVDAVGSQSFYTASILPLKTAINLPMGCSDSLAQILFVNNYYGREPQPYLESTLKDLGYKFDVWNVLGPTSGIGNTLGGSDPNLPQYHWPVTDVNKLLQYSTIIWHSGDMRAMTISPRDQSVIQSWVQQPGKNRNLWLTGDNMAYELATLGQEFNGFLGFTCGVRYVRDVWENMPQDSLHPMVKGVPGGPFNGRLMRTNGDCPLIDDFDLLQLSASAPTNGKAGIGLTYPNTFAAATRYATNYNTFANDSSRAVFMGFSFNDIETGGERLRLMQNVLNDYFKVAACYVASGVEDGGGEGAPSYANELSQNAPNPFNPETAIRYSVATGGLVDIRIYNVTGALVRSLVSRVHAPGTYTVRWNGTDDRGRSVPSGAYFYRIEANGYQDSKKLILLR